MGNEVQKTKLIPLARVAVGKDTTIKKDEPKVEIKRNGNIFVLPAKDFASVSDDGSTIKLRNGVSIKAGEKSGAKIDINTDGMETILDIESNMSDPGDRESHISVNSRNEWDDGLIIFAKDSMVSVKKDDEDYTGVAADNSLIETSGN